MRFIVSGLSKAGKATELLSTEDRAAAHEAFNAALAQADKFEVIEMKSGEDKNVAKWTNVFRQATAAPKKPVPKPAAAPVETPAES